MSVFLLPLEINRDIERSLSKFWWNTSQNHNSRLSWMSWERMASHKNAGGLGFRNFRDFNIAMLGKQGWRFITNPNSLVSRLYKAKYFVNTDFIHSNLGNNPSFIWRSIVEAKQLLMDGVRWRIGSGENIQILGQPWLMEEDNPFVTTNSQAIENKTVESLFCLEQKEWDVELIRDIFNERDQACILNIPLNLSNNEDTIFWRLEDSGVYSVKSAYKLLQVQKGVWNTDTCNSIWRSLWRMKAPPTTLNLVWRALSGCLPTMSQLQTRHVHVQVVCPVCKTERETIMHGLVTCSFARQCWGIIFPGKQWDEDMDFMAWMGEIFDSENQSKCAEAITLCWAIWRARNDLVWNHKYTRVNRVVAAAKQYLTQWKFAQCRSSTALLQPQNEGDGASVWVKPLPNIVKVSVDAAVFEDRGGVGFGMIARDSEGLLVKAKALVHPQLVSPILAEAMAIKEALSWIDHAQWPQVLLESDCLVAVQAIRSKTPMRSHLGLIIEDCRKLWQRLHKVSLVFVKRSANMVAHHLARGSYDYSGRIFDRSNIPIDIQKCIEMDLSI